MPHISVIVGNGTKGGSWGHFCLNNMKVNFILHKCAIIAGHGMMNTVNVINCGYGLCTYVQGLWLCKGRQRCELHMVGKSGGGGGEGGMQ